MKTKLFALAALTVFAISSAQAAVGQANTWTLQGVTFEDGTTASGTFSVDSSGHLTTYDIVTTTDRIYGQHYIKPSIGSSNFLDLYSLAIFQGDSNLNIVFDKQTTTSDTSMLVIYGIDSNSIEFDAYSSRSITSGSVFSVSSVPAVPAVPAVPEPETYALLLGGLGVLGFIARRRKSM